MVPDAERHTREVRGLDGGGRLLGSQPQTSTLPIRTPSAITGGAAMGIGPAWLAPHAEGADDEAEDEAGALGHWTVGF